MSFPVHIPNHPARHNWTVSNQTSNQSTSALTTGPGSPGYRSYSPFTTGQASSGPESRPSTTTGTRSEGLREEFQRGPHLAAGSGSGQDRSGVVLSTDGEWMGYSQTCGPPTQLAGRGDVGWRTDICEGSQHNEGVDTTTTTARGTQGPREQPPNAQTEVTQPRPGVGVT